MKAEETWTEKWINEDQPLFDVDSDTLIMELIHEGHTLDNAIRLVESLGVEIKIDIPKRKNILILI